MDSLLSLAFSLHSTPGSYAFLLGAGISVPSGVPSAWDVQQKLIERLAFVRDGVEPENPESWYRASFGVEPSYGRLLEHLAPTPHERQALLRPFFEPAEDEKQEGVKRPTDAHRALAQLMVTGAVRVVLTTNFDRLLETAVRDAGIEPVVVSSPSDIQGLAPLHTIPALIIHLHGDYLNPTAMLNTDQELLAYGSQANALLDQIFADYGLAIVGWSATYDGALRDAIARTSRRVFSTYWVEPRELNPIALDLLTARAAVKISASADVALGELAESVAALKSRDARHPLTVPVAVESAKRWLASRNAPIDLHDRITGEFERLRRLPELNLTSYHSDPAGSSYKQVVERIEEASLVPTALVATAAFWGETTTDNWWFGELSRFAHMSRGSGSTRLLSARKVVGTSIFYAAAVGAIAGERYPLLRRLLDEQFLDRYRNRQVALRYTLDPESVYADVQLPSKRLFDHLAPIFVEELALGQTRFEDAWERLLYVSLVSGLLSRRDVLDRLDYLSNAARSAEYALEKAEQVGSNANYSDELKELLRKTKDARDAALGRLVDVIFIGKLHIRVEDLRDQFTPNTARELALEIDRDGENHALLREVFPHLGITKFRLVMEAAGVAFYRVAEKASWDARSKDGAIPSYFWLDSAEILDT